MIKLYPCVINEVEKAKLSCDLKIRINHTPWKLSMSLLLKKVIPSKKKLTTLRSAMSILLILNKNYYYFLKCGSVLLYNAITVFLISKYELCL